MIHTCQQIYQYAREDIPITIYYAYKQTDSSTNGNISSGWETMLNAIIQAGFTITGTWPVRTESPGRMLSHGTNALASSIVLVCRKRPQMRRRLRVDTWQRSCGANCIQLCGNCSRVTLPQWTQHRQPLARVWQCTPNTGGYWRRTVL